MQFFHQGVLVGLNSGGDIRCFFQFLVYIEGAGERDFIADLGLGFVDPGLRIVGEYLASKVVVDILVQGHVFGIPFTRIRHRLSLLQNFFATFIQGWGLDSDFAVAQFDVIDEAALAHDRASIFQGYLVIF